MKKLSSVLILSFAFLFSCEETSSDRYQEMAADPGMLHACSEHLTNVIVQDIFKPPVASRIYAYSYLAAYEAMQFESDEYHSLGGKLNGFESGPEPEPEKVYNFPLASVKAFTVIGESLTFNGDMWRVFNKDFFQKYKEMGMPEDVYQRSIEFGEQQAAHILAYADQDMYKGTRGRRHTLSGKPGAWEPTPPTYAEACEPMWNTIRSFTLDSATQFMPPAPAEYDLDENSEFYALTQEVYQIDQTMTDEQREIAYFWDDNPFVTNMVGHATFTEKKMTPPGHWIEITRTVAQDKKLNMLEALEAYTLTSVALYDAFIGCWDVKYQSDRVRPVTVINQTIDETWTPFLETPPFPEYTSGHSSISAAAGRVLTHYFGDQVAFTDSTEYKYGHGVRSFNSFEQAYWETSYSRVYGGIHFRDAVEQGTYHGEKIGSLVWATIKGAPDSVIVGSSKPPSLEARTQ